MFGFNTMTWFQKLLQIIAPGIVAWLQESSNPLTQALTPAQKTDLAQHAATLPGHVATDAQAANPNKTA
jgi:hypothetical protein